MIEYLSKTVTLEIKVTKSCTVLSTVNESEFANTQYCVVIPPAKVDSSKCSMIKI